MNLDLTMERLRSLFANESARIKDKVDFVTKSSQAMVDEYVDGYDLQIRIWTDMIEAHLEKLLRYPPPHSKYSEKIKEFHQNDETYEKSVFIMTKFPDGETELDGELNHVIKTVEDAVKACGYCPRIATRRYMPALWDNVELYLLGCSRGVAIVEDVYKPELNPNVAVEWGWMRGMGKDVLYLEEQSFHHQRADWSGLIVDKFVWKEPEKKIPGAIQSWLEGGAQ